MKKTCFVIIGFGIRTDFATGRRINLDKTFENIIKPVFEELDILCYRGCDIEQSGVIDVEMYRHILKADFVVADISTLNPNAIYELGIRHALRPRTTIVIAEEKLKIPFDINHVFIHFYKHLEEDIGVTEAQRFRQYLKEQIQKLIAEPKVDSPVYTFLPNLNPPVFTEGEIEDIQKHIDKSHSTFDLIQLAEAKKNEEKFEIAKDLLQKALKNNPNDSFIIQRLALTIYKSKFPTEEEALRNALNKLDPLNPKTTTDPETLGLLGAIHKRLYEQTDHMDYLKQSLHFYERSYYVKQDYYNAINTAYLYALKASLANDKFEIYANYGQAKKIWREIINRWSSAIDDEERGDKEWVCLSIAEAYFGLENKMKEKEYVALSRQFSESDFGINSYIEQKEKYIQIKIKLEA